jgi:putative nucleotide binding protein
MSDADSEDTEPVTAVVLDYLPHGRSDDDRPQYQKEPVGYAVGDAEFRLYEIVLEEDVALGIDDVIVVDPPEEGLGRVREVDYADLSGGAQSELEYVVEDLVEEREDRFVDFYNDAQPITLRLHQLNLLPGIGKKLRNSILDERKRAAFEEFEDLEERVPGLHDPEGVLVDRIMEELREDDLKYRTFVRREDQGGE